METTQPSSSEKKPKLTKEQQEYICRQLAAFTPISTIVDDLQIDYLDLGLTERELYNRVRHIATTTKTKKWRRKIEKYRSEIRQRPLSRFPVANKFERMKILQRLIDYAIEPRVTNIFWYPTRKMPNGITFYGKCEVIEPHYHAALRALQLVVREIHPDAGAKRPESSDQSEER